MSNPSIDSGLAAAAAIQELTKPGEHKGAVSRAHAGSTTSSTGAASTAKSGAEASAAGAASTAKSASDSFAKAAEAAEHKTDPTSLQFGKLPGPEEGRAVDPVGPLEPPMLAPIEKGHTVPMSGKPVSERLHKLIEALRRDRAELGKALHGVEPTPIKLNGEDIRALSEELKRMKHPPTCIFPKPDFGHEPLGKLTPRDSDEATQEIIDAIKKGPLPDKPTICIFPKPDFGHEIEPLVQGGTEIDHDSLEKIAGELKKASHGPEPTICIGLDPRYRLKR